MMGKKISNKYINVSDEVRRLYNSKTGLKQISIDDFQVWYDSKKGCCDYCGLTTLESLFLFNKYPNATRGGRRGKRLELDRIDPLIKNYGDDINNLALAYYWCNNSKTNYFTYDELKQIGKIIYKIQKERF
jgi:hypothetical protein